jgi:hypothetical protein
VQFFSKDLSITSRKGKDQNEVLVRESPQISGMGRDDGVVHLLSKRFLSIQEDLFGVDPHLGATPFLLLCLVVLLRNPL